ncbi:MAG TPA: hypothetical protein VE571_06950, partial [Solirubrobacteraceae bacterium]|nr:hypothetical protein [Solirubrobacteraceae bacterium]
RRHARVSPSDLAHRINVEEASWTARTPARRISAASAKAAASERTYADRLARARWPASAQATVSRLVAEVRLEARIFAAAARRAPPSLDAWQRRLARLTPELQRLAHAVRRALHLPELVSGQLPRSAGR